MRPSHLLSAGFIAGSFLFAPAATHAAAYKHFTSKICPYTIDYPASWAHGGSKKTSTESFGYRISPSQGVGVVVQCTSASAGETPQSLTQQQMKQFTQQGYALSAPRYTGGAGIFKGQKTIRTGKYTFKAVIEVSAFVERSRSWVIFLFADRANFPKALPVYEHMLNSFHER